MMLGKNFQPKNKNYCFIFPIAFENNKSCKISMPNWVYYGGFQNSQLGHMLPRLPLMQCNHNNASGIPKRLKDLSVTCDDGQSFILFFIILSSSLPVEQEFFKAAENLGQISYSQNVSTTLHVLPSF